MHRRYAVAAILSFLPLLMSAQDVEKGGAKKANVEKSSRDFLMIQLTYEGWMKPDSIKTTGIGRGLNGYLCYDFSIKKSHFSFAAGIGIGTSNVYLKNQQIVTDSAGFAKPAEFITEVKDYKKYKLSTAYLEAPFELRFFGNKENRNQGFKAAIGLRVGTLVGAHTKGKLSGSKIGEKINSKYDLEPWRFAGTVRLGWGNFSVLGTYNLNNLYKENQGPEITPYSIGICITGL